MSDKFIIKNGVLEKYKGDGSEVVVSEEVTSIGDCVFENCESLTSITLPDSVTSIGNRAFCGCKSLTSIALPDSVTSIGDSAFTDCESLTSITLPDGVTSIGNRVFQGCKSLTSITLPNGVTSIGDSVFENCESLTSIALPDGVTSIGNDAFCGCEGLSSIAFPDSVTSVALSDSVTYRSLTKKIFINDLSVPFCLKNQSKPFSAPKEKYTSLVYDIRIRRFSPVILRIDTYKVYFDCDMSNYKITYQQFGKDGESTETLWGADLSGDSSIDYYIPGSFEPLFSSVVLYYDRGHDGILGSTILMPNKNTIIIKFRFTDHQYDSWGSDAFNEQICQISLEFFDS